MDTSSHTIQALFAQLGLPNSDTAIDNFIENNHLPAEIPLANAAFWSAGQAQFIREAIAEDADWAEAVDHLDAQLRH
jgi:hypothetical protein